MQLKNQEQMCRVVEELGDIWTLDLKVRILLREHPTRKRKFARGRGAKTNLPGRWPK